MKKKISIIIPACNEEKNIAVMLISVKKQIYTDWECIVVCNKCSDNTFNIAKTFENEDSRFRVFNFEWGGVSKARNVGINLSEGDLICFFDADDYVDDYYLQYFADEYSRTKEPLISCGKKFWDKNNKIYSQHCDSIGWVDIKDNIIFSNPKNDFGHCWSYLYKKTLIGDVRFNENISFGEDFLFNMEIIFKNKGVYNSNFIGYNYIKNNSFLSTINPNKNEILKHYSELEKKYGKNEIFRNFVYNFLKKYKYMICVENCDAEFNGNYAKFAEYCIKRINQRSSIINKNELKVEEILISPFLFFKSSNINGGFNFDGYDAIVFSEKPIINVCSENVYNDSMKHSYDTRLVGFNNPDLLEWWKEGRTDEEFYEYCKKHDYKIKVMFSNIMVDEKMCLFGVQWIPENMRKEHEIDIINFLKTYNIIIL